MRKWFLLIMVFPFLSCDTGHLKITADLPKTLSEVSGNETTRQSDLIWMMNDSGNAPKLYGLNEKGGIIKELKIRAKNNDWEDITSDKSDNLYIGDFGNNRNERKNLAVLIVCKDSLNNPDKITVEHISFRFENQNKFPPKKKYLYFDCEAFFHYNDSLFLFTKSRVHNNFGKTSLYKIPAKPGNHTAKLVSSFNTCPDMDCWITAADISDDTKKVVLLTPKSVWLFTNFKDSDFFSGTATQFPLNHTSQKEGICFKNDSILYITDEKTHDNGGFLYEFNLNKLKPKTHFKS